MSRLPTIDPAVATGATKDLFVKTESQLGRIPNLYRTMASAPAALEGYLAFHSALARGQLGRVFREQLALVIAELNHCEYCVSAHSFRGQKVGIAVDELAANRRAASSDPKTAAGLHFASATTRQRGAVSDEELAAARAAGWSDGEIGEIVAHVALNAFSNYFNHVAQPALDFPRVEVLSRD